VWSSLPSSAGRKSKRYEIPSSRRNNWSRRIVIIIISEDAFTEWRRMTFARGGDGRGSSDLCIFTFSFGSPPRVHQNKRAAAAYNVMYIVHIRQNSNVKFIFIIYHVRMYIIMLYLHTHIQLYCFYARLHL